MTGPRVQAPVVVVYANGPAPGGTADTFDATARLRADHLRHAVPLAQKSNAARGNAVSCPQSAPQIPAAPSGDLAGQNSGSRQAILRYFSYQTPAIWMAFLHAVHSGPAEVSWFYDVDAKTGRNWWQGVVRPTSDKVMVAMMCHPQEFHSHMLPDATEGNG